jgi:diguanylate cyclase (GGDEF)-like protein
MPAWFAILRRVDDAEDRQKYRRHLARRIGPMTHALMLVSALAYLIGVIASTLLRDPTLPLWLRLLPLPPLLVTAWATGQPRQPAALSLLTLLFVLLLEIGINLNTFGAVPRQAIVLPGLLLPVASSVIWLTRRDFAAGMALCALGPLPMLLLGDQDRVLIVQYGIYMLIAIAVATVLRAFTTRTLYEQYRLEQQLRDQANSDGLTGLLQRNRFLELAARALDEARRRTRPACVLYLDADHFKSLNDDYGHAAGDVALKALATTIQQHLRRRDIVGRIGGEEFAVLLPGLGLAEAAQRAEQLRVAVHAIERPGGHLSVSIGVIESGHGEEPIATLLMRADRAMRQAKREGRDRVVSDASSPAVEPILRQQLQ